MTGEKCRQYRGEAIGMRWIWIVIGLFVIVMAIVSFKTLIWPWWIDMLSSLAGIFLVISGTTDLRKIKKDNMI